MDSTPSDSAFKLAQIQHMCIVEQFGDQNPRAINALQNILLSAETYEQYYYIFQRAPVVDIKIQAFNGFKNKVEKIIELGQDDIIPTIRLAFIQMIADLIKSATTFEELKRVNNYIICNDISLPNNFYDDVKNLLKKYVPSL